MSLQICFIGGGNMARSLVAGLIQQSHPASNIIVTDTDEQKLQQLANEFGITVSNDNGSAVSQSDVVVLAVKPQVLEDVCHGLSNAAAHQPLFISIAAGVRSNDIERWLGDDHAIVRCMPNTPALLQEGATGLYANSHCTESHRSQAQTILSSAGITLWVTEESQLDAVTAVSGSGPAYFFLLMEAMQQAGEKLGLDADTASLLARQTALGAARMAMLGDEPPAILRQRVTSKGGTTAAAIASFEKNNFNYIVEQALTAACQRAAELADELGNPQA